VIRSQIEGDEKMSMSTEAELDTERADLLACLAKRRGFVLHAAKGLTEEQASERPTKSELCIAGIVKHLAVVEDGWGSFILNGPPDLTDRDMQAHADSFRLLDGETFESVLVRYEEAAKRTDDLVRTVESLDLSQPLPDAPWNPPGSRWTFRQVFLHLIGETAQHAGHADITRETIDGQKTMG
jgi:hypothetical protein